MSDHFDPHTVLAAITGALPAERPSFTALHEPSFIGNEWSYVKECLDTGWVSSVGKFVDRFELQLAEYTGVKRAVAVVNGTAALHLSLLLAGVRPGDEVLVPALTFVATANAVSYCGAVPHFVDSAMDTLGMDPAKLDSYLRDITVLRQDSCCNRTTGNPIRAVVPMHTFGHPVDLDGLTDVCKQYHLPLIEDAAESLGSYYKGSHTGNRGVLSALSFNGNKVLTTGGGGAVLTNDEHLGNLAKHLSTTARVPHPWELTHDQVGYNYRMPNINAALGCAQLEQLPEFLTRKRNLARRYEAAFSGVDGVTFFVEPGHGKSNYWLNALLLDDQCAEGRDPLLELLNTSGIQARPAWTLMHRLAMYRDCPRMDLGTAENIARRLVNIPSSAVLGAPHATS